MLSGHGKNELKPYRSFLHVDVDTKALQPWKHPFFDCILFEAE